MHFRCGFILDAVASLTAIFRVLFNQLPNVHSSEVACVLLECVHPMRYCRLLCVQSIVRTLYWLLCIQSIVRTSYELPQMIIMRTAYCAYILCVTADYCAYRVLCVQRIDCCAYVTEYCAYILCVTVYWLLCVQSIERTEYWLSCVHYRLLCVRLVKSKCARVLIRYCAYITEYCVYFG